MKILIHGILLAIVVAGTLYSRGEREEAVLATGVAVGFIIGVPSVLVDRWNDVQICDDKHKR